MMESSKNATASGKKDIDLLENIFEIGNDKEIKKVLIVGGAGVGKSTLM